MVEQLENAGRLSKFPRAALNALRLRSATGTSVRGLFAQGRAMKKQQDLTWAQLALGANAPMLTRATMVDGKHEVGIMPTGVGVGAIDSDPTVAEIIRSIVAEASTVLARLDGS